MNFRKYLRNIFVIPLFDDHKFYDPPPELQCWRNMCPMHIAQKICIFGAISLNKIFIKICSHPKISWLFLWPPISLEKILWPPAFSWPPPYSEENDSPLNVGCMGGLALVGKRGTSAGWGGGVIGQIWPLKENCIQSSVIFCYKGFKIKTCQGPSSGPGVGYSTLVWTGPMCDL